MIAAGDEKHVEFFVGDIEIFTAQSSCVFCSTKAVPVIHAIVVTLRIVEEGEQFDNLDVGSRLFGYFHSVGVNAAPVSQPVNAMPVCDLVLQNATNQLVEVDLHYSQLSTPLAVSAIFATCSSFASSNAGP